MTRLRFCPNLSLLFKDVNFVDRFGRAADAGFADSAHLSRTFRSLFGLAPSDILPIVRIESRFDRSVQAP